MPGDDPEMAFEEADLPCRADRRMTPRFPASRRAGRWRRLPALLVLATLAGCERTSDPVEPGAASSATAITVVSGGGQPAFVGTRLDEPIVFRTVDAGGLPVAGVSVDFVTTPGSGQVEPARAATDQNGDVSITWTLGPDPGTQTVLVAGGLAATAIHAWAVDLEAELEVLFAPPTAEEIAAVRADWADRDISPAALTIELTEAYSLFGSPATLRVVSHQVGEARHYGAIVVPKSRKAASLPVLMYLHGGDNGVDVDDVQFLAFALGELRDSFVYVIPSFRSEPLEHDDREWVSTGPGGHWDYDVDDALALLNVALAITPQAKPEALSLVGASRGGGVALLAGIRDASGREHRHPLRSHRLLRRMGARDRARGGAGNAARPHRGGAHGLHAHPAVHGRADRTCQGAHWSWFAAPPCCSPRICPPSSCTTGPATRPSPSARPTP